MSDGDTTQPGDEDLGQPEERTPSGEPAPGDEDRDDDEGPDKRPEGDPVTGSTEEDPSVEDTGLPPAGTDPMAGEAPSS